MGPFLVLNINGCRQSFIFLAINLSLVDMDLKITLSI